MFKFVSLIPRETWVMEKKKRRNLYLLPVLLPEASRIAYQSRTATQRAPRCICKLQPAFICHADEEPVADIHIPTGIYRCTLLGFDMKFCENFRQSRISADKRFPICRSSRACGAESTFGAIAGAKLYHPARTNLDRYAQNLFVGVVILGVDVVRGEAAL